MAWSSHTRRSVSSLAAGMLLRLVLYPIQYNEILSLVLIFKRTNTTGNWTLPSAFYRGTRQSNILPSAAFGKIKHSAKVALPSARHSVKPGSRHNWALLSADPTRQKVAGPWRRPPAVRFCRVPNGWHSAIFFIFKNLFCRVPAPDTRQFFLFFKNIFFRV